jgi:NTP pyrophosphatase (non-canonical NTP hydrolase)
MTINDMRDKAYANSKSKGFHDEPVEFGTRLALIHSEVSEALEAHRKGGSLSNLEDFKLNYDWRLRNGEDEATAFKMAFENHIKDSVGDELSDAMIRIGDLTGLMKIDIQEHVRLKMRYNSMRPHKHGKNY